MAVPQASNFGTASSIAPLAGYENRMFYRVPKTTPQFVGDFGENLINGALTAHVCPTMVSDNHIAPSDLFDFAEGTETLHAIQRRHLHQCEFCQLILKSFITRCIDNPPTPALKRKEAA